jgi:hypothetical protein
LRNRFRRITLQLTPAGKANAQTEHLNRRS